MIQLKELLRDYNIMNETQLKAIENLITQNRNYISKLESLKSKFELQYNKFEELDKKFNNFTLQLHKSSSHIYFVPYNNYYSITEKGIFFTPALPLILEDAPQPFGRMNEDFKLLNPEFISNIELDWENQTIKLKEIITENCTQLKKIFSKIIASNSITKRLKGLEDKLVKIESVTKNVWFPESVILKQWTIKTQQMMPIIFPHLHAQVDYPFHIKFLTRFEKILKTKQYHIIILDNIIEHLDYINQFLPFAELIPTNEINTQINNNFNPKQNQIGSANKFDGEINIGNEGL